MANLLCTSLFSDSFGSVMAGQVIEVDAARAGELLRDWPSNFVRAEETQDTPSHDAPPPSSADPDAGLLIDAPGAESVAAAQLPEEGKGQELQEAESAPAGAEPTKKNGKNRKS